MKNRNSSKILSLFFALASISSLKADLPDLDPFDKIAKEDHTHFFIETTVTPSDDYKGKVQLNRLFKVWDRLHMLEELIAGKNSPSDLEGALKIAISKAEITKLRGSGIRVSDQTISSGQLSVLNRKIKVAGFTGTIEQLVTLFSSDECHISLDKSISSGTGILNLDDFEAGNIALNNFSFDGSFRNFLMAVAVNDGPTTCCSAVFQGAELKIRYFAR